MAKPKSERFNIRIAADEVEMLRELADLDGLAMSDVFRLLVRREHAKRIGPPKGAKR